MKRLTITICLVLLMTALNIESSETEFFVDANSGSDLNKGLSEDNAWKTINHALGEVEGTPDAPVTINIAEGTYNMLLGETFPIRVKSNVTLQGAGMDKTILDAKGSGKNVMLIENTCHVNVTMMTITGGECQSMPGGGIYIESSDAVVRQCKITGNSAINGGGIFGHSPSAEIIDCVISKNSAEVGGGVFISFLTLKNCIIEDNDTEPSFFSGVGIGGGIVVFSHYSKFGAYILDCTIRNNRATWG